MKTYKHLFEQLIDRENIRLALRNASKNKRTRRDVLEANAEPEIYIDYIIKEILNFQNDKHIPKIIYDGITRKKRKIIVPTFREQVVHHAIVNVLKPIFMRGMYEHSYGSIPKRGGVKGRKYIVRWIRNDPRNVKYVAKLDIQKFFDSVDHAVLKQKLRRLIVDDRFISILETIIDVVPSGIPLGFYTSQWFSNWFLQDLDHLIKEVCGAEHYERYMDDMVLFGSNKRKLHGMVRDIRNYLEDELHLKMKANYQVFRFDFTDKIHERRGRMLDFMGFRFYRDRVTLRKSIMLKATRKARKIFEKPKPTVYDCKQMLSYLGWFKYTNVYQMYADRVKPYVKIGTLKRMVSRYDKKRNAEIRRKRYYYALLAH